MVYKAVTIFFIFMSLANISAWPAVGCTLNDPDRDIKGIFPNSTGYKTVFMTIAGAGARPRQQRIEQRLGRKLDPIYEAPDVAYAYYTVLKGKEPIGRVHGVNQKGAYGGLQIILATNLEGQIIDLYYQKISSPEAARFRGKDFRSQFVGLTLLDFERDLTKEIADPSQNSADDFLATLAGIKKNLILLDEFMLDNKYWSKAKGVRDEGN